MTTHARESKFLSTVRTVCNTIHGDIKEYTIRASWSDGYYPDRTITGTYRSALLHCRALAQRCIERPNSMHGSAYMYLNEEPVAGYVYDSDVSYNDRKLRRATIQELGNARVLTA